MKYIKYRFMCGDAVLEKRIVWSAAAEAIAKTEAVNGDYAIEDDGKPEPTPVAPEDVSARIAVLEEQLAAAKILLGVE